MTDDIDRGRSGRAGQWALAWWLGCGLATMGAGCGDDDPAASGGCVPNETRECACPDGVMGAQTCQPDGEGFDACTCPGGSTTGMDTDGGTGTGMDSDTDTETDTGSGTVSCPSGLVECDGTCIDPDTDETFCGASGDCTGSNRGIVCDAGEVCDGTGTCNVTCRGALTVCSQQCVDLQNDPNNCGDCGMTCGSDWGCHQAECEDRRHWSQVQEIRSSQIGWTHGSVVAASEAEAALAVWGWLDPPALREMRANHYDGVVSAWAQAATIEVEIPIPVEPGKSDEAGDASPDGLTFMPDGRAMLLYHKYDGERWDAWSKFWTSESNEWTSGLWMGLDGGGDIRPQDMGVDDAGNVHAVVLQEQEAGSNSYDVRTTMYDIGSGEWEDPVFLEIIEAEARRPRIAVSGDGNAIAVWQQVDGGVTSIWWSRYDAEDEAWWETPQRLENEDEDAVHARVAMDGQGHAIAVWRQSAEERGQVWWTRYDAERGVWALPERIAGSDIGDAEAPHLAVTGDGNAMAGWRQGQADEWHQFAAVYDAASATWTARALSDGLSTDVESPRVVADTNGGFVAAWTQLTEGVDHNRVRAASYDPTSSTWSATETFSVDDENEAKSIALAEGSGGTLIMIWSQGEDIWAARYGP